MTSRFNILVIISLFVSISIFGQTENKYWLLEQRCPNWALKTFKVLQLNESLNISDFVNPFYFEEDFNGDSMLDIALLVEHKESLKKGILIIHGKTDDYSIIGAGEKFDNRFSDISWMDVWKVYRSSTSNQLTYKENMDIDDSILISVHNPCLEIKKTESSSGLIYWNGKSYKWSQKSE